MNYGYPSGIQLVDEILDSLSSNTSEASKILMECDHSWEDIQDFRGALKRSTPKSIDEFLTHQPPSRITIAKQVIVYLIVSKENESEGRIWARGAQAQTDHWYRSLRSALTSEVALKELGKNQLRIVTFNYDRSLEHFLYRALAAFYDAERNSALPDWLSATPIVHIYGCVAPLPWQDRAKGRPYGHSILTGDMVQRMASHIRVLNEAGSVADPVLQAARDYLAFGENIYFLGFGYDRINIERLGIQSVPDLEKRRIAGTVIGLPESRTNQLRKQIKGFIAANLSVGRFLEQEFRLED